MQVQHIMSKDLLFIDADQSIQQAARVMRDKGVGFLGIRDQNKDKLQGVVTDRDIVIRGAAEELNIADIPVSKAQSDMVLYCYAEDALEDACQSMREQQVHRLVVLDNATDKRLVGTLALGDLVRHDKMQMASETLKDVLRPAA